jgi:hypothetical protein
MLECLASPIEGHLRDCDRDFLNILDVLITIGLDTYAYVV